MALDAAIELFTHQQNNGNADWHKVSTAVAPAVRVEGVEPRFQPGDKRRTIVQVESRAELAPAMPSATD